MDQACSVKIAEYWPRSLFLRFIDPKLAEKNKLAYI